MKSCYIVGAADFAPARFAPAPGDFVIAADAGILHLERLGAKPDLVLGDFDSLGRVPDYPDTEVSPVRKDDTDSMLAARRAVERG
ncbi:MAG TPA: thiamine diphosphokinase, partial [Candidatus Scatomorpha merdipullorum]|nr:thiamine diphosphokinase [Candidatus Scatomorpha merdipullorum]